MKNAKEIDAGYDNETKNEEKLSKKTSISGFAKDIDIRPKENVSTRFSSEGGNYTMAIKHDGRWTVGGVPSTQLLAMMCAVERFCRPNIERDLRDSIVHTSTQSLHSVPPLFESSRRKTDANQETTMHIPCTKIVVWEGQVIVERFRSVSKGVLMQCLIKECD